mgnify:CR=1 FL=1
MTWINTHSVNTTEMPHGGVKMSGYGSDLSVYCLEHYTVARHGMIKNEFFDSATGEVFNYNNPASVGASRTTAANSACLESK